MAALAPVSLPPQLGTGQGCDAGSDSDADECWICLSSAGVLTRPCACPRLCHRECIATWQLTNYGRREENFCRFCNKRLPALWKPDPANETEKEELRVAPVMAVRYNGPEGTREFKLRVRPGPEGLATFKAHLKEILGFDVGPEFDVTFECQMPATGSLLTLSGLNAYGAATHCAALLAATKASGGAGGALAESPAAAAAAAAAPANSGTPMAASASAGSSPRATSQQPQQSQQRRRTPTLLLPSEVPLASPLSSAVPPSTAAAAAAVAAAAALGGGPCSRRVCHTGYLSQAPLILQQSLRDSAVAADARRADGHLGNTASYASYLALGGGRHAGSTHVGTSRGMAASAAAVSDGGFRRLLRTASEASPEEIPRYLDPSRYDSLDDLDDDLLPSGRRHLGGTLAAAPTDVAALDGVGGSGGVGSRSGPAAHVAAAAVAGGRQGAAAEAVGGGAEAEVPRVTLGSVDGRPTTASGNVWAAGAVRFGGRVLPVAPAGSPSPFSSGGCPFASLSGAAAAAPGYSAVAAASPASATLAQARDGGATLVAATPLMVSSLPSPLMDASVGVGGSVGGSSAGGSPATASMSSYGIFSSSDVSSFDSSGSNATTTTTATATATATATTAAPAKVGHVKRPYGGKAQQQQRLGGDVAVGVVVVEEGGAGASASANAGASPRGGRRSVVPSALRRVARRTLDSFAQVVRSVRRK